MKAYTDLEQSHKLAEILPIESADLWWNETKNYPEFIKTYHEYLSVSIPPIPCWSLAALLDILPHNLKLVLAINDFQGDRKEKYVIGSVEHDKYDCFADNPVDACYEMIIKLHELNLL